MLDARLSTVSSRHQASTLAFYQCTGLQIVCTLGPKSRSVEILEDLLRAGMSVARFNFSHGSHDYHQVLILAFMADCRS